MVPSIVVPMTALPRSVANKIDFSALPEPTWPAEGSGSASATEQRVAEAWCQVLKLESFDRDANFFELGGDSFGLFACIARLREGFGRQSEPGEFFARSFSQLAEMLETSD